MGLFLVKNDFSEKVLLLEHLWHLGKGIIPSLINAVTTECNWYKSVQLAASGSAGISDFSRKAGTRLSIERSLPNLRVSALIQAFFTRHERSANCCASDLKQTRLSEFDFSLCLSALCCL